MPDTEDPSPGRSCPWNERTVGCLLLEENVELVQLLSTCGAEKVGRDRDG